MIARCGAGVVVVHWGAMHTARNLKICVRVLLFRGSVFIRALHWVETRAVRGIRPT